MVAPLGRDQVAGTTAPGGRNSLGNANPTPGQVYQLTRGERYLLTESIEPGVDVTIEAVGDGPRPLIQTLGVNNDPDRPIQLRTDGTTLTLRGVAVTNRATNGVNAERTIRMRAPDTRLVIEDVEFSDEPTMVIRLDAGPVDIFVRDTIVRDVGDPGGNENEGRFIDDRGNDIDSLSIVNSTFYNINSRVLRDDGGDLGSLQFVHNTVAIAGDRVLEVGDVADGGDVLIRDNLFANTGYRGATDDSPRVQIRFGDVSDNTMVTIEHLNYFVSDSFLGGNAMPAPFDSTAQVRFEATGNTQSLLNEPVTFTNAPAAPPTVIPDPNAGSYDFSYDTSGAVGTASSNGQPLGALTWFAQMITSAETDETPDGFVLHGAYPNPFNPTTTLQFDLREGAQVDVQVFDMLGRRVLAMPAGAYGPGAAHTLRLDASILPSGTYLYRLTAVTATQTLLQTGAMTLLK